MMLLGKTHRVAKRPEREIRSASEDEPSSGNAQAERSGKNIRYPEEFDLDIWGC